MGRHSGRGWVYWIGFRLDGRMERMGMKDLQLVELNNQSMMSLIAAQCLSTTPPLSILSLSFSIIDARSGHRKETHASYLKHVCPESTLCHTYRVENWEELFVASKALKVKEKNQFQSWTEDLNDMNLMISWFKI